MQLMFFNKWSENKSTSSQAPQSFVMSLVSIVQFTSLIKIIKKVRDTEDKVESQCKENVLQNKLS